MPKSDAAPTPARRRERRLGAVTTTSRANLTGPREGGETSVSLERLGELAPLLRCEHGARACQRLAHVLPGCSDERPEAREHDRGIGPVAALLHDRLHRVGEHAVPGVER